MEGSLLSLALERKNKSSDKIRLLNSLIKPTFKGLKERKKGQIFIIMGKIVSDTFLIHAIPNFYFSACNNFSFPH